MFQFSVPVPVEMEAPGKGAKIKGERETYLGTRYQWMICFSGPAMEKIKSPPPPKSHPVISNLKLAINKTYKVLYAKVGPEKIRYEPGEVKDRSHFTIHFKNSEQELEEMIHSLDFI